MGRSLKRRLTPDATVMEPLTVLAAGAVIATPTPLVFPPLATVTPLLTPYPLYAVGVPEAGVHWSACTFPVIDAEGPPQPGLRVQGLVVTAVLVPVSGEPQATCVLSEAAGRGSPPLTGPPPLPWFGGGAAAPP